MNNLFPDNELENELQELYILCSHQLQEISFTEDEIRFFKNILQKHQPAVPSPEQRSARTEFNQKILEQERHIANLRTKIPDFLAYLKPYIGDMKKEMGISFLEKYNAMEAEIRELFSAVRATKQELLRHTESIMIPKKTD